MSLRAELVPELLLRRIIEICAEKRSLVYIGMYELIVRFVGGRCALSFNMISIDEEKFNLTNNYLVR